MRLFCEFSRFVFYLHLSTWTTRLYKWNFCVSGLFVRYTFRDLSRTIGCKLALCQTGVHSGSACVLAVSDLSGFNGISICSCYEQIVLPFSFVHCDLFKCSMRCITRVCAQSMRARVRCCNIACPNM